MPKKILLIEADDEFAGQLKSAFEARGATVEQTADGKAAPGIASDGGFDAIVLCVELPKMSGYAVCNKLKKSADLKDIPLIITSSEATPKTFEQHKKLKTRAEEYVIKPCEAEEVVEKVNGLIGLGEGDATLDDEIDLLDEALEGLEVDGGGGGDGIEDIALDALEMGDDSSADDAESADLAIDALGAMDEEDEEDEALDLLGEAEEDDELDALESLEDLGDDLDSDGLEELEDFAAEAGAEDELLDVLDEVEDLEPEAEAEPDFDPDFGSEFEEEEEEEIDGLPELEMEAPPPRETGGAGAAVKVAGLEEELAKLRKERDEAAGKLSSVQDELRAKTNELEAFKSGGGAASNKDVIRLKGELTAKDKEILSLKEELNEKEKAALDWQEKENELELKAVDLEERAMTAEANAKTFEEKADEQGARMEELQGELVAAQDAARRVSELEASLEEARSQSAALEGQVAELGQRVAEASSEASDARGRIGELESELAEAQAAAAQIEELEEKVQTLESENRKHEDRLLKAYQNLKGEEQLRERIRKALEVGLSLLDEAPASVVDDDEGLGEVADLGGDDGMDELEEFEDDELEDVEDLALDSLEM
ncbi:MAG: response regulator [Deltaproteobacteria bacterium]|nr:response regulator [Deltaproteobacteria bacterium]